MIPRSAGCTTIFEAAIAGADFSVGEKSGGQEAGIVRRGICRGCVVVVACGGSTNVVGFSGFARRIVGLRTCFGRAIAAGIGVYDE